MKIIPWDEFRRQRRGEYQLTITPDQLRIGDFVCQIEALVPPLDFPRSGIRVESFTDKEWFKTRCRRVVIDLENCLNRRVEGTDAALSVGALPELPKSIDALRNNGISARRLVDAWAVYRRLSLISQAQILSFHRHGQIDVTDASDAIDELVDAVPQHLAALVWLTHIKEPSRYPFQHGLNTAILAAAFSHAAGWESGIGKALSLSAMLHDLGMMRISLKVLKKSGSLSKAEREHVELHTRLGHELLSQNSGLPDIAATVALCHHEQPDGQGYPEGLTQRGIPAMARLISVISAYEAMTTRRHHQKPLSHQQAMGELWKFKGKQFDEHYAEAFSKFLGWAPPGVMLRLPDGEIAASVHAIDGSPRPIVQVVRRRGDKLELGAMIDLSSSTQRAKDRAVVIADGRSGIPHRALTRAMPEALRSARVKSASLSQPEDDKPFKERRKRPRMNAPKGTRMLVIDDSSTVRTVLTSMLRENHYRLSEAGSAEEGLHIAINERPRLIFLDIILPDMNGFRVLRKIRSTEATRATPVIMISGNEGATEKFFLKRVGADDFIYKPFGRLEVFGAIERLIRAGALNVRVNE